MLCYAMLCYVMSCYVMLCMYIYMIRSESQNWGQWVWANPCEYTLAEVQTHGNPLNCASLGGSPTAGLCPRGFIVWCLAENCGWTSKKQAINQFNKKSWGPNQQNSQGVNYQLKTRNPNIEDKMPRIFLSRDERETCRKPRRGLEKRALFMVIRACQAKHKPGGVVWE